MHKKKLVHGDIKPSNIFVSPRPNFKFPLLLKIGDFGLSRYIGSSHRNECFKKGDGQYLAPELLDSKAEITTAVDMFSLGISVYEMATDFTASDALWNEICQNTISYEKVSKELKLLLAKMLCKEPSLRTTSGDCLFTNDKLRNIAKELGFESTFSEESSNEEMQDAISVDSDSGQENDNVGNTEEPKKSLDPIRKKLF